MSGPPAPGAGALPLGLDAAALADEIDRAILASPERRTEPVRRLRREYSRRLRGASPEAVLAVALALVDRHRWVACELVAHHPGGLERLTVAEVERLGGGLDDWGSVDAFATIVAGPAWRLGRVPDTVVRGWAASGDRWWRRTALVATVALNVRSRGGTGDPARTLDICGRLVADRDDLVVKALSWALRELVVRDPDAVRGFLADHAGELAPRVLREVRNKLATGRKRPSRG